MSLVLQRGDVVLVRLDPAEGREIRKTLNTNDLCEQLKWEFDAK